MNVTGSWIRLPGVVVALIGFVITRLFVAEAIQTEAILGFIFSGLAPLALGLGVTLYGVALAIGAYPREYVSTISSYCLIGVLVATTILLVTLIQPLFMEQGFHLASETPLLIANVLLGGAVGGLFVGKHAAKGNQKQKQIKDQANRTLLLNRLLRHEVINATTVVLGNIKLLNDSDTLDQQLIDPIEDAARHISETVNEVGDLIKERPKEANVVTAEVLTPEIESIQNEYPVLDVEVNFPEEPIEIAADDRLHMVIRELLENAAEEPETERIKIDVGTSRYRVKISISDDGPGLPHGQKELVESGEFPEYDDASVGFGLQIVRILVGQFNGDIFTGDGINGEGTSVTISLPRYYETDDLSRPISVSQANLYNATISGLLAGIVMGVYFGLISNLIPVIGALYSIPNPVVGWTTHLFHSVLFAFIFAGAYSHPLAHRYLRNSLWSGTAGLTWGVILWLFGAGIIMPIWLLTVGRSATLPNLTLIGFVSHAIWGVIVGVSYPALKKVDIF
jgi:two-component system OmpR family sensor kinase